MVRQVARFLKIPLMVLVAIIVLASGVGFLFGEQVLKTAIGKVAVAEFHARVRSHRILERPGMTVILSGTGEPRLNKLRGQPLTAVIANGEFLIFDAGVGAIRGLAVQGYPIPRISRVFITHMHSDHMSGLGGVINASFVHGRRNVIEVHGPDASSNLSHTLYPPTSEEYRVGRADTTGGVPDRRRVNELTRDDLVRGTRDPARPGRIFIPGIRSIVAALNTLHTPDAIIRTSNKQIPHGKRDWEYNFAVARPIPDMTTTNSIDHGWGELLTVYTSPNGKLKVKAFLVDHYPCFPSYGYRVEYAGRVVVISGDVESMLPHGEPARPSYWTKIAGEADVLVHEAHNFKLANWGLDAVHDQVPEERDLVAQVRGAKKHHTDVIDIAKTAAEARVAKLVLTHIGIPTPNFVAEYLFMRGMSEHYDGEIILAHDGMELYLPPR